MAMALRQVALGASGVETTALGFGCAGLFHLSSSAERARLLESAYDAGIQHFDVAPMYGLGLAETELGRFARSRRGDVTLATKFGIGPTTFARALGRVQGPMRRTMESLPAIRQQAKQQAAGPQSGRLGRLLYTAEGYDAAAAKGSLERSLRMLNTDYVDVLFLHDPVPGTVRSEEVCSYLEEAKRSGWIRSWGVAGEADPTVAVARSLGPAVPVLQLRDNIFLRSLRRGDLPPGAYITFGNLGDSIDRIVQYVRADPARRKRWTASISADCGEPEVVASLLLRAALQEDGSDAVIFSTTKPRHIHGAVAAAQAAAGDEDPALDNFLSLVETELTDRKTPQDNH